MSTAVQPVRSQRMSSKGSHGSREGRSTATVAGRAMLSRPRSKETKIAVKDVKRLRNWLGGPGQFFV